MTYCKSSLNRLLYVHNQILLCQINREVNVAVILYRYPEPGQSSNAFSLSATELGSHSQQRSLIALLQTYVVEKPLKTLGL